MNRKLSGAILAAAVIVTSCGGHKKSGEDMQEASIDVALPEIDSVTLSNTYPGQLTAISQVEVVARVSGLLTAQLFKDGQYVHKGDVLFRIEDSKYRDAVQQAKAALTTAISTRDYAKSHYEAVKKALESDAVSKMEVNQAESNLQQAEASIKNAQAELETANTNLSYCTITAPISGMASAGQMDVGNYVNGEVSAVTMTTLYDTSVLTAHFAIDENEGMITNPKNSEALFKNIPLSFSDSVAHKYYGDLSYVAPALEESTGTLDLRCHIKNVYNELKPGMFVKVNLPYKEVSDAILVKDAAISTDQLGKYLYVVNDSDRVVYTPIKVGPLYHDSLRVVTSGITPKSKYVTKALLKVKDGMTVKPHLVK